MTGVLRRRTRAREYALHVLYMVDVRGEDAYGEAAAYVEAQARDPEIRAFAHSLVEGVRAHREEIDGWIRRTAKNWDLERMAVLDRNVLRLGVYELLHAGEVPAKVAINEAIEMAKRYSTSQSGAFVNGILDRIRILSGAKREEAPAPGPADPAGIPADPSPPPR
ncbi:MAG TPA: transcription antitermination factor NusB [Planctomycetota bacterium]|nr:transcription antitermination factor NusB [Planctomycetota bacterium]